MVPSRRWPESQQNGAALQWERQSICHTTEHHPVLLGALGPLWEFKAVTPKFGGKGHSADFLQLDPLFPVPFPKPHPFLCYVFKDWSTWENNLAHFFHRWCHHYNDVLASLCFNPPPPTHESPWWASSTILLVLNLRLRNITHSTQGFSLC